ncbi:MAG: DUF1761 domain-containing protein [Bacteroidetes bacterium]|nr:DUF1761 domain-containing protein [Bacteroidota bacterium]
MKTNYLAIVACVVVNVLLGMSWYGVLAEPWMTGHGLTLAMVEGAGSFGYVLSMGVAAITAFILSLIFRRMGIASLVEGLQTGAAIGFLALLGIIVGNWYALKPLSLSFIDGGFAFLQYVAFGAILGGWVKK